MSDDLTQEEVDIIKAIGEFGETVKDLKRKRYRLTVAVSIAFAIILLAIGTLVLWLSVVVLPKIDRNANEAKRAAHHADSVDVRLAESELTRCKTSNDYKENDKARWDFIIGLAGPPSSPESAAKIDQLKDYIEAADKPKDCSKL